MKEGVPNLDGEETIEDSLMDIETRAKEVASRTEDAFSFSLHYRRKEWIRITRFLFEQGYSDIEVEEILRSKHMRWAADHTGTSFEATLADFQSYYTFDGREEEKHSRTYKRVRTRKSNEEYIREMLHDRERA